MPVLTRAAARPLQAAASEERGNSLALRESVTSKADNVWKYRNDVDVYCGARRSDTDRPQVDHCLEVQLAELALVRAFGSGRNTRAQSMATAQATEIVRGALNGVKNLNVTSTKINQAKRGPFTAAINRLESDKFRIVSIEQLARQGRGKWMVDDGTWSRIERAVIASYEAARSDLVDGKTDALPAATELIEASMDELSGMLDTLGFH
jgi:hypothetical protein